MPVLAAVGLSGPAARLPIGRKRVPFGIAITVIALRRASVIIPDFEKSKFEL